VKKRAMYKTGWPTGIPIKEKGQSCSKIAEIEITWVTVLIFPSLLALKTTPSAETMARRPVTANSRPRIVQATQAGTLPSSTSDIRAAETKVLSAKDP